MLSGHKVKTWGQSHAVETPSPSAGWREAYAPQPFQLLSKSLPSSELPFHAPAVESGQLCREKRLPGSPMAKGCRDKD